MKHLQQLHWSIGPYGVGTDESLVGEDVKRQANEMVKLYRKIFI